MLVARKKQNPSSHMQNWERLPDPAKIMEWACYPCRAMARERVTLRTPSKEAKLLDCTQCGCRTRHRTLSLVEEYGESADGDVQGWTDYCAVQCLGCNTVSFCLETRCSEDADYNDDGEMFLVPKYTLYPPRLQGRKPLEYDGHIPDPIHTVYLEAYTAIVIDLPVLAGIGLRAVLEMICKERGITSGRLIQKIDALEAQRIISPADKDILHNLRFLGNQAAHDAKPHTLQELLAALDVIEHLLKGIYVVPARAKAIPQRPPGR